MNSADDSLGRSILLRVDVGRSLVAMGPAWGGVCGLLSSGGLALDGRSLLAFVLLLLLAEPLMGGLWTLALESWPSLVWSRSRRRPLRLPALPYGQPGALAPRLLRWLESTVGGWQAAWPEASQVLLSFVFTLTFYLAIAAVLGVPALLVALAGLAVLILRTRFRAGLPARFLAGLYDLAVPWLLGMAALGRLAPGSLGVYRLALVAVAVYVLVYTAAQALLPLPSAAPRFVPALLVLDLAQIALLALLVARFQVWAAWLLGLGVIGQLAMHRALLQGGAGSDYVRRIAPYVLLGMVATAMAVAPVAPGG